MVIAAYVIFFCGYQQFDIILNISLFLRENLYVAIQRIYIIFKRKQVRKIFVFCLRSLNDLDHKFELSHAGMSFPYSVIVARRSQVLVVEPYHLMEMEPLDLNVVHYSLILTVTSILPP